MKTYFGFLLIAVAISWSTLAFALTSVPPVNLTKTFSSQIQGISLSYPILWEIKDTKDSGVEVLSVHPSINKEGIIRETLTVVSENLSDSSSLETFYTRFIDSLKNSEDYIEMDSESSAVINGLPAKRLEYSENEWGVETKTVQYFFISKQRLYILTYLADTSEFREYEPVFEEIIGSIKVITP